MSYLMTTNTMQCEVTLSCDETFSIWVWYITRSTSSIPHCLYHIRQDSAVIQCDSQSRAGWLDVQSDRTDCHAIHARSPTANCESAADICFNFQIMFRKEFGINDNMLAVSIGFDNCGQS